MGRTLGKGYSDHRTAAASGSEKAEEITYERWFAIGVGQMGLKPSDFDSMTVAQFIYAHSGWNKREQERERQNWERARYMAYMGICVQVESKDRLPITQMCPLPWDDTVCNEREVKILSIEERRERALKILGR